jgi:hypothetical protein
LVRFVDLAFKCSGLLLEDLNVLQWSEDVNGNF